MTKGRGYPNKKTTQAWMLGLWQLSDLESNG